MTDLNLDRLEQLEQAATEGPWTWFVRGTVDGDSWAVFDSKNHGLADNRDGWGPDAEFIAEMRNATPALLARVRELEATVEKVREVVESEKHWNNGCGWDVPAIRVLAALEAIGGDDA